MFSRLAEFELSLLFTNKAAEHWLYLERISIPCEGFKNISKKRRKTQVKSDLERQPQCLSLLTSTICFQQYRGGRFTLPNKIHQCPHSACSLLKRPSEKRFPNSTSPCWLFTLPDIPESTRTCLQECYLLPVTAGTCLMAVTVITKKSGRPLVTGLVGVSTITCRQ